MTPTPIIVDFETDAIVGSPIVNPPKPCGVSIQWPGYEPNYFAWGHPEKNNCTRQNGCMALGQVYDAYLAGAPLCFQNAPFDLSVWRAMPEFKINWSAGFDWKRIHDTLYLIFLIDPYAQSFSLKPSAHRLLGIPPDEADDLEKWILAHVPEATGKTWGAYISRAPGDLVGRYANGDTRRTGLLFNSLYPRIVDLGMLDAYNRERRLAPITTNGTRRGIRCDVQRLGEDERRYSAALTACEGRLCHNLGITQEQLEDDEEALKDGLERAGAVKEWILTPKSKKRSLAAGNLKIVIPEIRDLLDYRGALKTSLQTFMRPWLAFTRADGRLHPNWNQVRQAKGDFGTKGARTGRLSSDEPNFMNLPTDWEYKDGTPMVVPPDLLPYPDLRSYILPEVGHVWLKRDFSSQEIRITAHFEDGQIKDAYIKNPDMDPHALAAQIINMITGLTVSRITAKIIGFSIIYGSGGPGLSANLNIPLHEAYQLKAAYLEAMPGINALSEDVKLRGETGIGIRTWGGRVYLSEPPKIINGVMRAFHYKLLNYLVQGSAADQTKDCINEWHDLHDPEAIFLGTVHDEIDISAPADDWERHMALLKKVMERDRFIVPFRSEGFVGPNWSDLRKCA